MYVYVRCILQVSGTTHYMRRYDSGEGIIKIQHNTDQDTSGEDTWLVVQKQLTDASQVQTNTSHSAELCKHACVQMYMCVYITCVDVLYIHVYTTYASHLQYVYIHTRMLACFDLPALFTQFKAEVEVTEVALAFPLSTDMKTIVLAKVNVFVFFF